jgi:hypothetical protein
MTETWNAIAVPGRLAHPKGPNLALKCAQMGAIDVTLRVTWPPAP